MNENIFYAAFFFPAAAAVLVFFMKYVSEVLQARVRMRQDAAYRDLAASAAAGQAEIAATLASFGGALGDIRTQLAAVTKILKEVE